jgi:hypothetical protein
MEEGNPIRRERSFDNPSLGQDLEASGIGSLLAH